MAKSSLLYLPWTEISHTTPRSEDRKMKGPSGKGLLNIIVWVPPQCRHDLENPRAFTIWHNVFFTLTGSITVANLYYNHPILNVIAADFEISDVEVSKIPTLMQAGYATGILILLPLGDMVPRRHLTLFCVLATALMWFALCITQNWAVFLVFSFLTAAVSVTPQIMVPLVADLSTPEKRAFDLSIVSSGTALGIVFAKTTSGILTQYTTWRNIYWISLGLQYALLLLLWTFMPDYPPKNKMSLRQILRAYATQLPSIWSTCKKHPVLVQHGSIALFTFVPFTSYWTTVTFLLTDKPYNYDSTIVGLCGLIGLTSLLLGPILGRYLVQPLREPLFSLLIVQIFNLGGVICGTVLATHSVAGVIIEGFTISAGVQIVQISCRIALHPVEPSHRNRTNMIFVLMIFAGQLIGSVAGITLFEHYGGWRASGYLVIASLTSSLVIMICRGPYEQGWFGWSGGWHSRPEGVLREG